MKTQQEDERKETWANIYLNVMDMKNKFNILKRVKIANNDR